MATSNRWQPANNGAGKRPWFLIADDETALTVDQRYYFDRGGRLVRYASYQTALRAADQLHRAGRFPG